MNVTRPDPDLAEPERLLHELRVHQVELESQNRALREAQWALEESRDRYVDLYDFAPVAYFTFDKQGCIVDVNLTGAGLLGRDRARLLGMPLVALVSLTEPWVFFTHLRLCSEAQEPATCELAFRGPDGEAVFVHAVSTRMCNANGEVVAFRTAITNITARKRAESEERRARASEARLRGRLEAMDRAGVRIATALGSATLGSDASPVLEAIIDEARRMTAAHFAALALTGPGSVPLDSCVVRGATLATVHRIADIGPREGILRAPCRDPEISSLLRVPVVFAGAELGHIYLGKSGRAPEFTPEDEELLAMFAEHVGYAVQIAQLKESETRERSRLTMLSEVTKELAASLDLDLILKAVTRSVVPRVADHAAAYWRTEENVVLVASTHVRTEDEEVRLPQKLDISTTETLVGHASRGGEAQIVTDPNVDPVLRAIADATPVSSALIVPVMCRDVGGALILASSRSGRRYDASDLALVREISSRAAIAIDKARLYAEAQAAVRSRDNLLAVVSHDLRSPLNAVSLSAGVLLRNAESEEKTRKQSLLIRRSAQRMNRLIEDLLTATTIEAGRFTVGRGRASPAELIEEAHAMLEPELTVKGLRVERRVSSGLPDVICDRERILQVFANLLGNAIKFTPEGGSIGLSATPLGDERVVRFAVADSGPGVAEVQRPHLFDRYWKGQASGRHGVGLGLYIAKGIVDAHGGTMWVESKAGAGATFCFTLPLTQGTDGTTH